MYILQLQASRTEHCPLSAPAWGAATHPGVCLCLSACQRISILFISASEFAGVHVSTVCKGHQTIQLLPLGKMNCYWHLYFQTAGSNLTKLLFGGSPESDSQALQALSSRKTMSLCAHVQLADPDPPHPGLRPLPGCHRVQAPVFGGGFCLEKKESSFLVKQGEGGWGCPCTVSRCQPLTLC